MSRQIAVAFQGGGARLIGLIAAAHALSELERSLGIKIRAVSGSSAGSIAAFLLAADANFDQVKDAIRKINPIIKLKFPKLDFLRLYYKLLRFLITGSPIYNPQNLERIIDSVLLEIGINPQSKIQDIKRSKKMFLMYADIYSASSEAASNSDIVRTAIARSCSLPIVFSSYKDVGSGQRVDGGILDNLPTDVLMRDQTDLCPVFAIGFKPERRPTPNSPWAYLYSLATSGIQHRIQSSKKAVGEDMVLELDTSLGTLDFDRIVDVGIEREYNLIKEQTRQFFLAYLSGHGNFTDPLSESRGLAPFFKLKSIERSIYNYVSDSERNSRSISKYLKMRVNAYSLLKSENYDEIIVEQLFHNSDTYPMKGIILPLTVGDGYLGKLECNVHINGPDGDDILCEQFIIGDFKDSKGYSSKLDNSIALLFKCNLSELSGRLIYVIKKEQRYGFMLPLLDKKIDHLSVKSFFVPNDEMGLALSVPADLKRLRCEWVRDGEEGPQPEVASLPRNLVPAGFVCYAARLKNVEAGTRLKGSFYCEIPDALERASK